MGRYELHELLRQFAAEQLEGGERAAVEERHATFYLNELAARERQLAHIDPRAASAELQPEIDNLRQAWAWAAARGRVTALNRSARALMDFYWQVGLLDAGEHALAAAIAGLRAPVGAPSAGADTPDAQRLTSRLLAYQAMLLCRHGRYDQAITVAQDAIQLGATSGEPDGEARGYLWWGAACYRGGQYHDACGRLAHALQLVSERIDLRHPRYPPITWYTGQISLRCLLWLAHRLHTPAAVADGMAARRL